MNIRQFVLCSALLVAAPVQATSVSYFLDQSNALPDSTDYLKVTLTETESGVKFQVQTLAPLNGISGSNFGIQQFGFNFASDTSWEIEGLPRGWREQENKQMSEFGRYDIRLKGTGHARTGDLQFTVGGTDLSDFDTFFAAHVAGFEWCLKDNNTDRVAMSPWSSRKNDKHGWHDDDQDKWVGRNEKWHGDDSDGRRSCRDGKGCITSAYFGGGSSDAIPLPASAWLLISGMVGFGAVIRRRRNSITEG